MAEIVVRINGQKSAELYSKLHRENRRKLQSYSNIMVTVHKMRLPVYTWKKDSEWDMLAQVRG